MVFSCFRPSRAADGAHEEPQEQQQTSAAPTGVTAPGQRHQQLGVPPRAPPSISTGSHAAPPLAHPLPLLALPHTHLADLDPESATDDLCAQFGTASHRLRRHSSSPTRQTTLESGRRASSLDEPGRRSSTGANHLQLAHPQSSGASKPMRLSNSPVTSFNSSLRSTALVAGASSEDISSMSTSRQHTTSLNATSAPQEEPSVTRASRTFNTTGRSTYPQTQYDKPSGRMYSRHQHRPNLGQRLRNQAQDGWRSRTRPTLSGPAILQTVQEHHQLLLELDQMCADEFIQTLPLGF